eukprot:CAMPEP_0172537704 /NCGR_PEP_ID=MMETSP1067-20121228/9259_1 /TAXON_ID=265564 ORGANISM="Thalassiosira punctigera, Strain Tpunct2005C2" /NCGR_SAMPLE_ID=MMETSP1067 /ASSEMBLY_ACC=CAM_ASM_000444 /LENGTH=521 /DNA_ID=CAMNT_0013323059 /DNA_START=115 /DNA_END=1680 /DNA_ORIENTATION=-
MSQMDLSQQALESSSSSDQDNGNRNDGDDDGNNTMIARFGGGIHASISAADADDEFADAMESLDHIRPAHHNGSIASSSVHHERNYGILERCGRWLMAIPRDDVVALQQTSEYREFLYSFDKLGEAHRRTVTLERQHLLMESEDKEAAEYSASVSATAALADFSTSNHTLCPPSSPTKKRISSSIATFQPPRLSHPLSPTSALRRRRYSFLQHLAVDDVLLRIFEFIDCSSLVRTGTTCHRFRELTTRSAEQRTQRLADGRLLRSAMKMLRAQEQIEGVGPREEAGPFVPIPMLGLRRRVKVVGAGDPEYNGIYFCTGSNGNGFLFTKPRSPERRVRVLLNNGNSNNPPTFNMQQMVELDGAGGIEEAHPVGGEADGHANNNNDFFADNDAVGLDVHVVAANEDNGDNGEARRNGQREDAVDVLFGDEPNRSRLLRCVIAKRFSNETILWYMSKEIEDESSHQITQNFSFWAKLLVTGDATPDVCQYPSQSSILSRNGEPAWQPLTNTMDVIPPIVELLDG